MNCVLVGTNRLWKPRGTAYRRKTATPLPAKISCCATARSAKGAGRPSQRMNCRPTTNKRNARMANMARQISNYSASAAISKRQAMGRAGRCDGEPVALRGARRVRRRGRTPLWRQSMLPPLSYKRAVMHLASALPDPGSRTTGIAIIREQTGEIVWAAELTHRGHMIRDALLTRRSVRRNRRQRKTRYRQARFLNRRRQAGWLPPSLTHRIETSLTWVGRLRRFCPIVALSQELVGFDTQLMQNAE